MASRVGATVSNPDGFQALINAMSEAASESTLRKAAVAGARVILNEVKLRAPVGETSHKRSGTIYPPGTLKKNIIIFHDDDASALSHQVYGVVIGRDAFYGRIVEAGYQTEYGRSDVPAHPFFRPAVDAKYRAALDAMTDVMNETLQEAKNV